MQRFTGRTTAPGSGSARSVARDLPSAPPIATRLDRFRCQHRAACTSYPRDGRARGHRLLCLSSTNRARATSAGRRRNAYLLCLAVSSVAVPLADTRTCRVGVQTAGRAAPLECPKPDTFSRQLRVGQRQQAERSRRRKADPQLKRPDSRRPRSAVHDPERPVTSRQADFRRHRQVRQTRRWTGRVTWKTDRHLGLAAGQSLTPISYAFCSSFLLWS
jgi:hypothetical protein